MGKGERKKSRAGGGAFMRPAARSRGWWVAHFLEIWKVGYRGRRRGEGDVVVVLVCSKRDLMTARADRCRRVTYIGVFVGQGPGAHGSIVHGPDNTHSRTALLFWHHLARRSCNRAIGRKGGTILSKSPALHHLEHPGEDLSHSSWARTGKVNPFAIQCLVLGVLGCG
jgi:hypothetical protein